MHALFYVFNLNFSWSNLISFASNLHLPFINCKWMSFINLKSTWLVSFSHAGCLCRTASLYPVPPWKGQDVSAQFHLSIFLSSLKDSTTYLQFLKSLVITLSHLILTTMLWQKTKNNNNKHLLVVQLFLTHIEYI